MVENSDTVLSSISSVIEVFNKLGKIVDGATKDCEESSQQVTEAMKTENERVRGELKKWWQMLITKVRTWFTQNLPTYMLKLETYGSFPVSFYDHHELQVN